jgi:hypothetical protein
MVDGSMVHRFSVTDLVPLILQSGSLRNRAKTKGNFNKNETRFTALSTVMDQWLAPRGKRYTWVWCKGFDFRGLASAKSHSTPYAWIIDLFLIDEQDKECCLSLLEKISSEGEELQAIKIFLRLSYESPLIAAAEQAGFSHYVTERLYCLEKGQGKLVDKKGELPTLIHHKLSSDEYRLFELYESCVPLHVRRVEGMTFREWQSTKDKDNARHENEMVYEKKGTLVGWFRTSIVGNSGHFEVMASPDEELEKMLEYSMIYLNSSRYLFCLNPEFQHGLRPLLIDKGFVELARYSTLVKELAIRAQEPCLMPVQA